MLHSQMLGVPDESGVNQQEPLASTSMCSQTVAKSCQELRVAACGV